MTFWETDCRVPDPTDAKADGQFQQVNRRAGYGDDRLERTIATARKGWTLAAGEGLVLVQEIDRLREERDAMEGMYRHHVVVALEAIERLNRAEAILAALREPSLIMRDAVRDALNARDVTDPIIGEDIDEIIAAAVAAAEREVCHAK
jgi:hypothetical protein